MDTMTGRGGGGGGGARRLTYADIVASSLRDTLADKLPVREVVATLDPLINPVLNPFVEGEGRWLRVGGPRGGGAARQPEKELLVRTTGWLCARIKMQQQA